MTYYMISDSPGEKCCKATRHLFYHFGAILNVVAIIITLLGCITKQLFYVRIFDLHRMELFEMVNIRVGLFDTSAEYMLGASELWKPLKHSLSMSFLRWTFARITAVSAVGMLVMALGLHLYGLCKTNISLMRWKIVLPEVICTLLAVAFLVCTIGLCETDMYELRTMGDPNFYTMLSANNLLSKQTKQTKGSSEPEYDLFVSLPQMGYWILTIGDFTALLAFLFIISHLVVVCKKNHGEKKKYNVTNRYQTPRAN